MRLSRIREMFHLAWLRAHIQLSRRTIHIHRTMPGAHSRGRQASKALRMAGDP
jgi:hypothetical protein